MSSRLPSETLRAGDTIEYYSMTFECGNKRGHRVQPVLEVDHGADADQSGH
ncbi:hypothetical protein PC116_g23968 [Phytophthora cactorum]|uniref:Uncharacterized protein n=1 Tax=Phytophthora cactorum TaxID=29920 RepID=A0A8T1BA00_9STRA|nr:hypothetical protein Pcac1_g13971 [Phytophthora cactorum]KAG2899368.1 hypothetical protein PC117_g22246 [Phytophthora cactorum]KAG3006044.1 hypothetical protein PC120_g17612 [Phytophthora cactorum]KAG3191374.1 hypothetical protein PC128_g10954 [Phytophthora cactorum]KAG4046546.1 hypothetical protein PC123_g18074 [Phytophthora cactorum]